MEAENRERVAWRTEEAREIAESARQTAEASRRTLDSARRALQRSTALLARQDAPPPKPAPSLSPHLEHLDKVLSTEELDRRPFHDPDHDAEAEAEAYAALTEAFDTHPEAALQRLTEIAMDLCGAESAGVSIEEHGEAFRWRATAGALRPLQGTTLPRDASPCGLVVDRRETLLMEWPEWVFPAVAAVRPRVAEVLLTPVYDGERPIGTLWVTNHGGGRPFNAEDRRLLESLMRFIAPAYRLAG